MKMRGRGMDPASQSAVALSFELGGRPSVTSAKVGWWHNTAIGSAVSCSRRILPRSLQIKAALSASVPAFTVTKLQTKSEQPVPGWPLRHWLGNTFFGRLLRKIRRRILRSHAVLFWSQSRLMSKNCRPALLSVSSFCRSWSARVKDSQLPKQGRALRLLSPFGIPQTAPSWLHRCHAHRVWKGAGATSCPP